MTLCLSPGAIGVTGNQMHVSFRALLESLILALS